MRLRLVALPLLVGIVVPAGALAAPPRVASSRGIGIRLVPVPTDTHDLLGRSYIVDRLSPGTTLRRRIEIRNSTPSTAQVAVYVAAANFRGRDFSFASGHTRNELSSWTTVSRDRLRLAAGGDAYETVSVDVPKAASSGERYAVIWAEVSAPAPTGGGVKLVNRVGVRMYLSIGRGGAGQANFVIGRPTAKRSADGEPLVVATVRNSGKRTLKISGTLTLANGPGGLRAGPFTVKLPRTLEPNSSEEATVALDRRLPRGPWRARLQLSSGFIQRRADATITFPPVYSVRPPGSRHTILFVSLLVALLAGAALSIPIFRRMRQRRGLPTVATRS